MQSTKWDRPWGMAVSESRLIWLVLETHTVIEILLNLLFLCLMHLYLFIISTQIQEELSLLIIISKELF